ncbi:MAG: ATP synthase F1 subunit gamma [Candidatus Kerfeldbacteria bacterium CG_4_10_14_0_8_um_filter_42_10]|uniref:ATP synthase gamma chain n=1 Tax=Candidatus Kerfeldbacteria bacterium CG_4_10_14_0_8_um_filter_42_10 TaxID=2014248 RepID=A0A2M7RJR8_9BACT|nr:MAG: ATP synthase F1 subunit gamma [Candidatus Kerfeldbacteria bacterium CG_4_10_14_0_8_um_filter_42_10]
MPQATRDIKRRIKSVRNTHKVTKAMEMVAAAKMRKAVSNVVATRSYSNLAWELVKNLARRTDSKYHPLLEKRDKIKKIGMVLITSNRGLCGGFNNQIIDRVTQYVRQQKEEGGIESDLVIMGKKGREAMLKKGHTIIAEFTKLDITNTIPEIRPLSNLIINDYLEGKYDQVMIAYTDFISTLVQKPRILELLPIEKREEDRYLGQAKTGKLETEKISEPKTPSIEFEYLFEPSADEVLGELLPRLLEMQIYQVILESDASEHSSRMVAMRNASDAAADMIDGLTLIFNKARQASITAELADISGGRIALE